MKNFLKIVILIFMCFVSAGAGASGDIPVKTDNISPVVQVIYPDDNETENSVVSSNFYNTEIVNLSEHKQNFSASNLYKTSAQDKFLSVIFTQNYNRVFLSKTHKISYFLRNEICTRAP